MQIPSSVKLNIPRHFYEDPQNNSRDKNLSLSDSLTQLELHREVLDFSSQENGQDIQGHMERLDLTARFTFDNKIVDLHIEVERQVIAFGATQLPEQDKKSLLDSLSEEVREKIEGYLNAENGFPSELSPQNVSQNIFNFATSNYNNFLNGHMDEKPARQNYLDKIQPAVEKGFDDALTLLDSFLTDDIKNLILETRSLTQEKFDNFLGLDVAA